MENDNPYAAPNTSLAPESRESAGLDNAGRALLARRRPMWSLVLAVGAAATTLGAALVLLDALIAVVFVIVLPWTGPSGPGRPRHTPTVSTLFLLPSLAIGVMLLLIGSGLRRLRPWARWAAVLGCLLLVPLLAVLVVETGQGTWTDTRPLLPWWLALGGPILLVLSPPWCGAVFSDEFREALALARPGWPGRPRGTRAMLVVSAATLALFLLDAAIRGLF